MKTALIFGISGQDGAYLSQFLLNKHYQVYGTTRSLSGNHLSRLRYLGIQDRITLQALDDFSCQSFQNILKTLQPDEIYYLAGQSSVGLSFSEPAMTFQSIANSLQNLLEAVRQLNLSCKIFNAGSGDCFGESSPQKPIDEKTSLSPKSPYAVAKTAAYWIAKNYRESYGIKVATGHLFNHESILRGSQFVTQKIFDAVIAISEGKQHQLSLGNIDIIRDWGFSKEYVEAMWQMLQQDEQHDYIIATGHSLSLRQLVELAFEQLGLSAEKYLCLSEQLLRPNEIAASYANPNKAFEQLGWRASTFGESLVALLIKQKQQS